MQLNVPSLCTFYLLIKSKVFISIQTAVRQIIPTLLKNRSKFRTQNSVNHNRLNILRTYSKITKDAVIAEWIDTCSV